MILLRLTDKSISKSVIAIRRVRHGGAVIALDFSAPGWDCFVVDTPRNDIFLVRESEQVHEPHMLDIF